MIGNEAVARGAYEAGVRAATAYPGTPSTEIVSKLAEFSDVYSEWAPNEKVALEVGAGASIAGVRTLVAMKHVGVNVAADPLYTFSYTGVNGGLVLVSADDPGMFSSQNEQDNRGYGKFAKLMVLEPSDSQEAKDFTRLAFHLSEYFDGPIMLRITTRLAHSQTLVELGEIEQVEIKEYKKEAPKYVMLPGYAKERHIAVEQRIIKQREYAETSELNVIQWGDRKLGIVTSGVSYQYVKEVLPHVSVLKLGIVNPLPERLIKEFAAGVERLVVVEELEPFIEEQIKIWGITVEGKNIFSLVDEYTPELVEEKLLGNQQGNDFQFKNDLPGRPPLLCPGCPHRGVFYTLNRMKLTVMGDIGCYTLGALAPLEAIDACICMGASIGSALGFEKAKGDAYDRKTVAVIGDSTFVHSGITALIDVVYNKGTSTVLILDNDTTAMTGHQNHPGTGVTIDNKPTHKLDLEALVKAIGVEHVRIVDPLRLNELRKVLQEELARLEPSVIIAKRPCALIVKDHPKQKYFVDDDKCKSCKLCIKIGCTGISFNDETKKAYFNEHNCVTCGLCPEVCSFDAISLKEEH
jgi:indolepyruvate ferredoxin oxidoreductase alpha subunit